MTKDKDKKKSVSNDTLFFLSLSFVIQSVAKNLVNINVDVTEILRYALDDSMGNDYQLG